jgi:hypothetical protein
MTRARQLPILLRVFLAALFLVSIALLPWYVPLALGLVLLRYSSGYEVLAGGLLFDILYGAPMPWLLHAPVLGTLSALIGFVAANYFRERLL